MVRTLGLLLPAQAGSPQVRGVAARQIVAAIEEDEPEVLADELSRHFKSALSGPVSGLSGR